MTSHLFWQHFQAKSACLGSTPWLCIKQTFCLCRQMRVPPHSCKYLGYMLCPEGLTMAPQGPYYPRLAQTRKVKDVQSFLGFGHTLLSFHLQITPKYSSHYASYPQGYHPGTFPMSAVRLEALKKAFTTAPVLTIGSQTPKLQSKQTVPTTALRRCPFRLPTEWRVAPDCIPLPAFFLLRNSNLRRHDKELLAIFWSFQMMVNYLKVLDFRSCGHCH